MVITYSKAKFDALESICIFDIQFGHIGKKGKLLEDIKFRHIAKIRKTSRRYSICFPKLTFVPNFLYLFVTKLGKSTIIKFIFKKKTCFL